MIIDNSTLAFGVPANTAAIMIASIDFTPMNWKKKQARGNTGAVIAVANYPRYARQEFAVNGYKTPSATVGAVLSLTGQTPFGSLWVDESDMDESDMDKIDMDDGQVFQKFAIKASVPIES